MNPKNINVDDAVLFLPTYVTGEKRDAYIKDPPVNNIGKVTSKRQDGGVFVRYLYNHTSAFTMPEDLVIINDREDLLKKLTFHFKVTI